MKILFVVQAYQPSRGGVQLLVQELAERMAGGYGDDVTVFTTTAYSCELFIDPRQPRLRAGTEPINGVEVRRFAVVNQWTWLRLNLARIAFKLRLPGQDWLRGLYFGPIIPGLRKAIARSDAEVVIASSFPMIHMYAALHGGQAGHKPVVMIGTVHPTDKWSYELPRMFGAIRQAQAYIALSTYERDYLVAQGVPADHIRVIGAGIQPARFAGEQAQIAGDDLRRQQGWGNAPVVAVVGRQTWYKRADVALAAMQIVWQQMPSARLVIAGAHTRYSTALHGMVSRLPEEQRRQVTIVEDFQEDDKPALYSACDVLLQPSERESFGIVFLEAWAAGKPVIGARAGAAPSIIDEGVDGLLATYGDSVDWAGAISQVLRDPKRRIAMGQSGRSKVLTRYTWDAIAASFRAVFASVL